MEGIETLPTQNTEPLYNLITLLFGSHSKPGIGLYLFKNFKCEAQYNNQYSKQCKGEQIICNFLHYICP